MLFNFILNQYLFLALARQQAALLIEGWCQLPTIPPAGQWANFLRNHDELDDQACMVTLDLSDYSITCLLDLLGDRQY
jgi:hypothetical protein